MQSVDPMNQDVERSREGLPHELVVSGDSAPRLLIAVIAAGASRRLGRPKQLVDVGGESLLRRQCRMAIASGVGAVVAILGCCAEDCEAEIADLSVTRRVNASWADGLASSIQEAVRAAEEVRVDGLLLVHVDQYQLTPSDLIALSAAWWERPSTACVAAYGECIGPPVIFASRYFASLMTLEGDVGARRILSALPSQELRRIPIDHASFDLDQPDQLATVAIAFSGNLGC